MASKTIDEGRGASGTSSARKPLLAVSGMKGPLAVAALAGVFVLVFLVILPRAAGNLSQAERYRAFAEMNVAVGLKDGDAVYADKATWPAGGKNAKAYADVIASAKIEPSSAIIVDGAAYNDYISRSGEEAAKKQEKGKTWQEVFGEELTRKVLRSLIVVEKSNAAYYYLMPTNITDPLLVMLYDKDGVKRQFRGSYKNIVPMRRQLQPRWFLLMTPPLLPADFNFLKGEEKVKVHYARTGNWMVSAALIEVTGNVELKEMDARITLMPLIEGWKAE